MNQKRLEAEWRDYRRKVIPLHAPEIQITESKRAFFSGAWALFTLMINNFEPGAEETPKDLQLVADLDAEMRAFAGSVRAGKA